MSNIEMMGAGGGGGQDFQLTQFALSVLEFQGSVRAVLNRDAGEMPRPGEIAALLLHGDRVAFGRKAALRKVHNMMTMVRFFLFFAPRWPYP